MLDKFDWFEKFCCSLIIIIFVILCSYILMHKIAIAHPWSISCFEIVL